MMQKTMSTSLEQDSGLIISQNSQTRNYFSERESPFGGEWGAEDAGSSGLCVFDAVVRSGASLGWMLQSSKMGNYSSVDFSEGESPFGGEWGAEDARSLGWRLSDAVVRSDASPDKDIRLLIMNSQQNMTSSCPNTHLAFLSDEQHSFIGDAIRCIREVAIFAKISEYRKLPYDFDGDNGHAPDEKDIINVMSFVRHIPNAGIAAVRTMVVGDGEVGFEWKEPKKYCLEISFSDGEISFFGDMPNGERLNGDAVYDENDLPKKLQRLLSAIFPG